MLLLNSSPPQKKLIIWKYFSECFHTYFVGNWGGRDGRDKLPPLPFLTVLSEPCALDKPPSFCVGKLGFRTGPEDRETTLCGWVSWGYNSFLRSGRFYFSVSFSSLESCNLTTVCCLNISKALVRSQSLLSLNLSTNNLLDDGVKLLCEGLMHPKCNLEKLSWVFLYCFLQRHFVQFCFFLTYELSGSWY